MSNSMLWHLTFPYSSAMQAAADAARPATARTELSLCATGELPAETLSPGLRGARAAASRLIEADVFMDIEELASTAGLTLPEWDAFVSGAYDSARGLWGRGSQMPGDPGISCTVMAASVSGEGLQHLGPFALQAGVIAAPVPDRLHLVPVKAAS